MFPSINIFGIIRDHWVSLGTFVGRNDIGQGKSTWRLSCIIIFLVVPFSIAILAANSVSKDLISLAVNTSSIFSALLLNLMVLLYQMKQKTFDNENESNKAIRLSLIRYTFTNAAFSVLLSVIILISAITASFFAYDPAAPTVFNDIFNGIIIFFSTMLAMTLLVIIKRMMKLFDIN